MIGPNSENYGEVSIQTGIEEAEKFELDLWYIDNKSIFLDIKILILTVIKVFKREGIDQGEDLTMENNTAKEFTSKLMALRHSAYGKKERRVFCVRTALNGLNSKTKFDFIFLKKGYKTLISYNYFLLNFYSKFFF